MPLFWADPGVLQMFHLEQIRELVFLEVITDSLSSHKLKRTLAVLMLGHGKGDKAKLQGQDDYSMTSTTWKPV